MCWQTSRTQNSVFADFSNTSQNVLKNTNFKLGKPVDLEEAETDSNDRDHISKQIPRQK